MYTADARFIPIMIWRKLSNLLWGYQVKVVKAVNSKVHFSIDSKPEGLLPIPGCYLKSIQSHELT